MERRKMYEMLCEFLNLDPKEDNEYTFNAGCYLDQSRDAFGEPTFLNLNLMLDFLERYQWDIYDAIEGE